MILGKPLTILVKQNQVTKMFHLISFVWVWNELKIVKKQSSTNIARLFKLNLDGQILTLYLNDLYGNQILPVNILHWGLN